MTIIDWRCALGGDLSHACPNAFPDGSSVGAALLLRLQCQFVSGSGPTVGAERAVVSAVAAAEPVCAEPVDTFWRHCDRCEHVDHPRAGGVLVHDSSLIGIDVPGANTVEDQLPASRWGRHRTGFLDVVHRHGPGPDASEGGRGFGGGEDARSDCVAAGAPCAAYGAGGERVAAGPQPGRDQIPEVAVVVVAAVVVRWPMLDPAHLAVDEELHAGDL